MTWSRGQIQKTKSSTHTAKVVADHQPLPKYDCSCLSNELTARDRPQVFRAAAQRIRDGLVGRRLVNQKRIMSRPGLRWYTAIRPTLSRSKRGSKAGQPLTAADVALCTRHRPVRRIASIAPREGSVAPGFCSPSVHHHQHSRAGQGQRRAARRGAELTRATLFVENGGGLQPASC